MGIRSGLELSLALACRLSEHRLYGGIFKEGAVHSSFVDQFCQRDHFLVGPEQNYFSACRDEHFPLLQCVSGSISI